MHRLNKFSVSQAPKPIIRNFLIMALLRQLLYTHVYVKIFAIRFHESKNQTTRICNMFTELIFVLADSEQLRYLKAILRRLLIETISN